MSVFSFSDEFAFDGVSLAEFFSEDPSVAADAVNTTVNSNKHVTTACRLSHANIFMFVDVFSGKNTL
jgi:hypothetical protein